MNQTTIKNKSWRRDRADNDIVNINGKKQKWGQFKSKFYEDLDASNAKKEELKLV